MSFLGIGSASITVVLGASMLASRILQRHGALSADGLRAYGLWKAGDLEHLTACDRPGWNLESGVCYPRLTKGSCMAGAFGEAGRKLEFNSKDGKAK